MSEAPIIERKRRIDGSHVDYACERLLVEPGRRAVLRYISAAERRLEGTALTLPVGTVTIGHFWTDRSYTVYAFSSGGVTRGLYCSIVDATTISDDLVAYTDLFVDVLIDPGGAATVLDEEELPDDIEPRHRRTINRALEELTGQTRRIVGEIERESRPFR